MRPVTYITSMARSFRHSPGLAAQYLAQELLRWSLWTILSPLVLLVLVLLLIREVFERAGKLVETYIIGPTLGPIWAALDGWRSSIKTRLIARRKAWEAARSHD
jgi:hypothetical protein